MKYDAMCKLLIILWETFEKESSSLIFSLETPKKIVICGPLQVSTVAYVRCPIASYKY